MDCFISYASSDVEIALKIKERLRLAGFETFLAHDSIPAGTAWSELIRTKVKRSDLVVLLDSPSSRSSAWVQQEAGMALASGALVVPISLDGRPELLPAWLAGIQAITLARDAPLDEAIARAVGQVSTGASHGVATASESFGKPQCVGEAVLKAVLIDQFPAPQERAGAWSRQYDRYLRMYYGEGNVRSSVSQGASLTLTGMNVERLSPLDLSTRNQQKFLRDAALRNAASFVTQSQDVTLGGFGRLSSDVGARAGRSLNLDLRHTCWAIRTLLSLDAKSYKQQIEHGLDWLSARATIDHENDRWCWTTAPLLSLTYDARLGDIGSWVRAREAIRKSAERALEASFDANWCSWVRGEEVEKQGWVSVDNALYVLYCLKGFDDLSSTLQTQIKSAIVRLLARSVASEGGTGRRGIPLFTPSLPEVGPTAQLLEIMFGSEFAGNTRELADFVIAEFQGTETMPQTFSWHLAAILASEQMSRHPLDQGGLSR